MGAGATRTGGLPQQPALPVRVLGIDRQDFRREAGDQRADRWVPDADRAPGGERMRGTSEARIETREQDQNETAGRALTRTAMAMDESGRRRVSTASSSAASAGVDWALLRRNRDADRDRVESELRAFDQLATVTPLPIAPDAKAQPSPCPSRPAVPEATSITMAQWSLPSTGTTRKDSTDGPETKPWSMRSNRAEPCHGPQVRSGDRPVRSATATAASVRWDLIRLYAGQSGVEL